MQLRTTVAIRIGVVISLTSLVLMVACGPDDALEGSSSNAGAADSTPIPVEATPASTAVLGVETVAPNWQEFTVGIPAIQPMLPLQPGRPSFTEQSVRDYVAAHPPRETDTSKPLTVNRVEFLPVEQVEVRIDHPVSVPRESLLCLVAIEGTWILPARIKPTGTPNPDAVMYLIFDAVTGNYIAKTSRIESD